MGERNTGTATVLAQKTQVASSISRARRKEPGSRSAIVSAAQTSKTTPAADQCPRQFKHSLNGEATIDSLCLRCGVLIASVDDEWFLLDHERRHVCRYATE